jgi:D-alanyl-D-alanine carboxypeptidase/D-alanyl-D-alanine-endopeptidase (penicillin-binding protein 4)
MLFPAYGQKEANPFLARTYRHAEVGLLRRDLASGRTITAYREQLAIMPASVIKIITAATALELLGPDYRCKTTLEYQGNIEQGHLKGHLIIRGGGDPGLGSRYQGAHRLAFLKDWVEWVRQRGIRVIDGNLLVDESLFDKEPVSPFWLWEDIGNYYAAGVYGIAFYDNSFTLHLSSGEAGTVPSILYTEPELPDLVIENQLMAASDDKDSAYFYGMPYQWYRRLSGSMPAHRKDFTIRGDLPDPARYLASVFSQELAQAGIILKGQLITRRDSFPASLWNQPGQLLGVTSSDRLIDYIRLTLYHSDNLYAEYLLRHIALSSRGAPASSINGTEAIKSFWKQKGVDVSCLYIKDGSGLSPMDRVSADLLAAVLTYMAKKSAYKEAFVSALPRAGMEGTVSSLLRNTPLAGRLRIKSGSNQLVTAYAGYLLDEMDKPSEVVIALINHPGILRSQVKRDVELFLLKH